MYIQKSFFKLHYLHPLGLKAEAHGWVAAVSGVWCREQTADYGSDQAVGGESRTSTLWTIPPAVLHGISTSRRTAKSKGKTFLLCKNKAASKWIKTTNLISKVNRKILKKISNELKTNFLGWHITNCIMYCYLKSCFNLFCHFSKIIVQKSIPQMS